MNWRKLLFSFTLILVINSLCAQSKYTKWCFVLNASGDVDLVDLVVDSVGNTYAAINYSSTLTIPIINKKLPQAYVHGLIIKLDVKGKTIWAHPFISAKDNRINNLKLAPNGDLLITGFGDGLLCFPGKTDTLKLGIAPEKNMYGSLHQGFYAARYTPDGDRKWAQYFSCPWGEGLSIAGNTQGEVYMSFYNKGTVTQGDSVINILTDDLKSERIVSMAKFDAKGKLIKINNLGYNKIGVSISAPSIKFDKKDNLYLYGKYAGKIKLSKKDSLTNSIETDRTDAYLAKYNTKDSLLWVKSVNGYGGQEIREILIAPDNSVYGTGVYNYECMLSDSSGVLKKSERKNESDSFFYMHLLENGDLDFVRFEGKKGYVTFQNGSSIALDADGKIHIVGSFTDTMRIDKQQLIRPRMSSGGFYSLWNNQSLVRLEQIGQPGKAWIMAYRISISGGRFATGGTYYGENNYMLVKNKKMKLSGSAFGRKTFICGGLLPIKTAKTIDRKGKSVKKASRKNNK